MTMSPLDRPPGLDALFDLTFTRFVTISVVRIIYLLGMLLLAVLWLIMVVAGFMQGCWPAWWGSSSRRSSRPSTCS
jgi:hypothetical protein